MPLLIAKLNTRWSSSSICSSYPQSSWLPQAHVPIPIGDTVNGPTFTCTHTNVPPGWTWVILNNGFFLLGFWNFFGKIWKSRGYQKHPKLRKQQGLQQATEEREREREREIYRIPLTSKTEGTEERSRGQAWQRWQLCPGKNWWGSCHHHYYWLHHRHVVLQHTKPNKKKHTHTRASLHSRAFASIVLFLLLRDWLGQLNPRLEFH